MMAKVLTDGTSEADRAKSLKDTRLGRTIWPSAATAGGAAYLSMTPPPAPPVDIERTVSKE